MTNSVDENANARATAVALHRLNTSQIGNDVIQVFRASDLFRLSSKQTLYGISDTKLHVFTVSVVFLPASKIVHLDESSVSGNDQVLPTDIDVTRISFQLIEHEQLLGSALKIYPR